MTILTSVWGAQHPDAGKKNIQQSFQQLSSVNAAQLWYHHTRHTPPPLLQRLSFMEPKSTKIFNPKVCSSSSRRRIQPSRLASLTHTESYCKSAAILQWCQIIAAVKKTEKNNAGFHYNRLDEIDRNKSVLIKKFNCIYYYFISLMWVGVCVFLLL